MGAYATAVLATTGIVSFYDLDDTSGTVAVDSKAVQNGAYSGTVTLNQPGQSGQSAQFASSDGTMTVTTHPLSGTTSVTLEAWVYPTSVATSNQLIIYNGNSTTGYGLYVSGNGTNTGHLYGLFQNVRWFDTGYVLGNNQWYHVALVLSATSKPTVYVNGVSVFSDSGTNPATPAGGGTVASNLAGNVDGAAFYSAALSAGTVLDHYNVADAYLNGCTMPCRPPTIRAPVRGAQTEGLVVACPFGNPVGGQPANLCTGQAASGFPAGAGAGNGRYGINSIFTVTTGLAEVFTHASVDLLSFTAELWVTFRQWKTTTPFISALWNGGSQSFRMGDTNVPWDCLESPAGNLGRLRANTTHQFVLVGSPSGKAMYVDGVQVGTGVAYASTPFTTSNVNKDDAASGTRGTGGEFHMYHLWNRPLSAQEVAQRYADPWGLYEAGGTDVNYLFTGLTYPPVGPALVVSL